MHILYCVNQLHQEFAALQLTESFLLHNVIEKFTMAGVLKHQVHVLFILENLVQLGDVGMPHFPKNFNFTSQSLSVCFSFDFALVNDLNSHLFVCDTMLRDSHF